MRLRQYFIKVYKRLLWHYQESHTIASPRDVERAEQIFYIRYLQQGMTVFDIGANVGELTMLFSRFVGQTGRILSFEPTSDTFLRLQTVVESANCSNVHLHHCAVTDRVGKTSLYKYENRCATLNSFAERPVREHGLSIAPVATEDVETVTVDSICTDFDIHQIDLMKVDVEGAELQVLLGAQRMLTQKRVKCVAFEFGQTTFDMGNKPDQIKDYLQNCGYKIRNVIRSQPIFPGGTSVELAQYSMHIATP